MAIRLGCHRWTFGQCTIREAALIARALGFEYMDLGTCSDFELAYIAEHIQEEAERLDRIQRETGIKFWDALPKVQPSFANNHPDAGHRALYRRQLGAFFDLAECIRLDGVTLDAGRYWPNESPHDSFERGAEELRWAVSEARARGLKVRIEPHLQGITWTPDLALAMVRSVPGLSLTIDHSHLTFCGLGYEQIAVLHPYASHWHARQARAGQLQCRAELGEIDFDRIVSDLQVCGYDGVISLEYVHSSWMGLDTVDCLRETVLLRDRLSRLLA